MTSSKQTRLKIRRGFIKVPLSYKVLAINQLSSKDKKVIVKTLVKVTTDVQAKQLLGIGSKWGWKQVISDRAGIITYKGNEIALMFKRATTVIVPLPADPIPEGTLENPDDIWIRWDLFGMSARQQMKEVRAEVESQETDVKMLQMELDAKDKIIASLEQQVKGQQTIIKKKIMEVINDQEVNRYIRSTIVANEEELKQQARKRRMK